jgi:hypothetical protein
MSVVTTVTPWVAIGAELHGVDGAVGSVSRILVGGSMAEPTVAVVVRPRASGAVERILPLSWITSDGTQLRVALKRDGLGRLPQFTEEAWKGAGDMG